MQRKASRIGIIILMLTLVAFQAISLVSAYNGDAAVGIASKTNAALLQPSITPAPFVDPPWVAQTVGRKPWQWPCDWTSPFNLGLSVSATYGASPNVGSIWTSQLPIYNSSKNDPIGTFYIRDGSGLLQTIDNSQST